MIFDSIEKALKQWKATSRELKLNNVKAHLRSLEAMCYMHNVWADEATDNETVRHHHEIIHSLEELQKQHKQFLDNYGNPVK